MKILDFNFNGEPVAFVYDQETLKIVTVSHDSISGGSWDRTASVSRHIFHCNPAVPDEVFEILRNRSILGYNIHRNTFDLNKMVDIMVSEGWILFDGGYESGVPMFGISPVLFDSFKDASKYPYPADACLGTLVIMIPSGSPRYDMTELYDDNDIPIITIRLHDVGPSSLSEMRDVVSRGQSGIYDLRLRRPNTIIKAWEEWLSDKHAYVGLIEDLDSIDRSRVWRFCPIYTDTRVYTMPQQIAKYIWVIGGEGIKIDMSINTIKDILTGLLERCQQGIYQYDEDDFGRKDNLLCREFLQFYPLLLEGCGNVQPLINFAKCLEQLFNIKLPEKYKFSETNRPIIIYQ